MQPVLLTDEQMRTFVARGYLTFQPDLPPDLHQQIRDRMIEDLDEGATTQNNLLPRVPELARVFGHPQIVGALQSILGADYYLHLHRAVHDSAPGREAQLMHQDSFYNSRYAVDGNRRHHHCRWAMAFYYAQDTTEEMGPSGIIPHSQYLTDGAELDDAVGLTGGAGTVIIVHHDLFHGGLANVSADGRRVMIKLLFTRMSEPTAPSWEANDNAAAHPPVNGGGRADVWRHQWRWLCGSDYLGPAATPDAGVDVQRARDDLGAGPEWRGLAAAYRLGESGERSIATLVDALTGENPRARRRAAYGFGPLGSAGAEALAAHVSHVDADIRCRVVDAIGDMGRGGEAALEPLLGALDDHGERVKAYAADALGLAGQRPHVAPGVAAQLAKMMADRSAIVRRNAALSLARLGPAAACATPQLADALAEENHYVRGYATLALRRIGTTSAQAALLDHLEMARWDPSQDRMARAPELWQRTHPTEF